jgi:hypothetical protein
MKKVKKLLTTLMQLAVNCMKHCPYFVTPLRKISATILKRTCTKHTKVALQIYT